MMLIEPIARDVVMHLADTYSSGWSYGWHHFKDMRTQIQSTELVSARLIASSGEAKIDPQRGGVACPGSQSRPAARETMSAPAGPLWGRAVRTQMGASGPRRPVSPIPTRFQRLSKKREMQNVSIVF